MAAFKSKNRRIRDGIVNVLQGVTLDAGSGAEPAFGLVTSDPSVETNQEPTVLVYPAPSQSTGSAIGQRDRKNAFAIFIVLSMENGRRTQGGTYDLMADLTELAMDALDRADFHNTLLSYDPTIGSFILETSSNVPTPAESKAGAILLCTIDVAVTYSKDL